MHWSDVKRLSNRELVDRLVDAAPEDPAWNEFVARFQGRIRLAMLRSFRSECRRNTGLDTGSLPDAVVDLTQEVFIKLLDSERRALSRFRGRSDHSIFTYLSTIAVNLVRDHFKRLRAQKTPRASASLSQTVPLEEEEGPSFEQAIVSDGPGPDRYVASQELRERMVAAVAESSAQSATAPRDRLIFYLYFIEGLTVGEIARIPSIELSASGIEKCIRRIRETLREKLDGEPREVGASRFRLT